MTPMRVMRCGSPTGSPRSPGWPATARAPAAARSLVHRPVDLELEPLALTHIGHAGDARAGRSAPATAWPCGSRISGLGITSTTTLATRPAYEPAIGPGEPPPDRVPGGTVATVRITHFGHSCLLVDTGAARLLFDPAPSPAASRPSPAWTRCWSRTSTPTTWIPSGSAVAGANPDARLIVDAGTAEQLGERPTRWSRSGASIQIAGSRIDVLGGQHAVIHPDIPVIANNAYLIDGTHLHPGDSFTPPPAPVDVLFLPTGAPWLKLSEAVDYLRAVAPRTAVPIHEAVLAMPAMHYRMFEPRPGVDHPARAGPGDPDRALSPVDRRGAGKAGAVAG